MKYYPQLIFAILAFLCGSSLISQAQTPFTTDDTDVTDKGKYHFELLNEYDILQKSLYPNLRQNTTTSRFAYGLSKNIEIGLDAPLITIFSVQGTIPKRVFGLSDASLHIKVKLHEEKETSRLPALAAAFYIRFPTGSVSKSLGSGVTNYLLYGAAQKSISEQTKVRLNVGVLFAGNTTIGVIGIRTAKVKLFSGGLSIVRQFTPKLKLGAELNTVVSSSFELSKGQLQTTIGGNYNLKKNLALDFGILAGRFPASPRLGFLIGFTHDF